jgi:hypothetical protein
VGPGAYLLLEFGTLSTDDHLVHSEPELTRISEFIVLICSPEEWLAYLKDLSRFKIKKYYNYGEPTSYPCLVFTVETDDEPYYYFEHRFLYKDGAQILVDKYWQINSRFSHIIID